MAGGRVSVLAVALPVIAILAKPGDAAMGRFREGPASRRWRYKCEECGYVVTRMKRQSPPPPCNKCNGQTKHVRSRRRG